MTGRTTTGRTKARRPRLRTRRTTLRPPPPTGRAPHPPQVESPALNSVFIDVMRDMPAIPKRGENEVDGYFYRRLDDVIATLHDVCAKHGLSVLPVDVEVTQTGVRRSDNSLSDLTRTSVKVTYELDGPGGFHKTVMFPGEATDRADKSTQKAMSQAWKYLMAQAFMIPVEELTETAEADHTSPHPATVINNQRRKIPHPRPAQGAQRPPGRDFDAAAYKEANYLTRALQGTYQQCREIYLEAEKDGAQPAILVSIQRLGEKKKKAESAGQIQDPQSADGQNADEPGGDEPGGDGENGRRLVPDTPAPEQSPEQAERIAALNAMWAAAEAAGHTEPSDVAQAFFAQHGWVMEDATPAEISAFAASLTPPGQPTGQDGGEPHPTTENPEAP